MIKDGDFMKWIRRYEWWIVGALACLAFAMGYLGIAMHYSAIGLNVSAADVIYGVLQLYRVSYSVDMPASAALAAPNGMLQLARFLAPATVAYSLLRLVAAAIGGAVSRISVAGWEGHSVVCGAGERGFTLAKSLMDQGHRVVVVDSSLEHSHLSELRAAGAKIFVDSALDETVLRRVRVSVAKNIAAVTGDERTNFAIAAKCAAIGRSAKQRQAGKAPVSIKAHASKEFAEVFEEVAPFGVVDAAVDVRFFNSTALAARQIIVDLSAEYAKKNFGQSSAPRFLVIGDGGGAAAMLNMLLRQMQLPRCQSPVIDVVSPNTAAIMENFPHAHPQLSMVGSVDFHEVRHGDILSGKLDALTATSEEPYDIILICVEDAFAALKMGRSLSQQVTQNCDERERWVANTEVVICLKPTAALVGVETHLPSQRYGRLLNLTELGCCGESVFDEVLDAGARAAHESYLKHQSVEHDPTKPATAPWAILKEEFKDANRRTIDHDHVKRLYLAQDNSEAMIEALAEAEHRSWMADRILAGWRKGSSRDDPRKLHPSLIPYSDLSDPEKDKDIEKVQRLI